MPQVLDDIIRCLYELKKGKIWSKMSCVELTGGNGAAFMCGCF